MAGEGSSKVNGHDLNLEAEGSQAFVNPSVVDNHPAETLGDRVQLAQADQQVGEIHYYEGRKQLSSPP